MSQVLSASGGSPSVRALCAPAQFTLNEFMVAGTLGIHPPAIHWCLRQIVLDHLVRLGRGPRQVALQLLSFHMQQRAYNQGFYLVKQR